MSATVIAIVIAAVAILALPSLAMTYVIVGGAIQDYYDRQRRYRARR